jgi:hypothetical protein
MYRAMPMWYGKHLSKFEDVTSSSSIDVSRIPATGNSPPCLKISQKIGAIGANEKANLEFIRLSLPVKCNEHLQRNK